MKYRHKNKAQVSYGEAVGILLLDSPVPFIPGDVANATSYSFPVRFRKVKGFTVAKALDKDPDIYPVLLTAARDLEANGVRVITGDCGFMALHQEQLKADLKVPVCLSSLFQIPFIRQTLGRDKKIGIITASAAGLTPEFLKDIGVPPEPEPGRTDLVIRGVEDCPEFFSAAIEEKGTLDDSLVREEMVRIAQDIVRNGDLGALLLECSLLPPYAAAVHQATGLPVYDYITMINYLFSTAVPRTYAGFM